MRHDGARRPWRTPSESNALSVALDHHHRILRHVRDDVPLALILGLARRDDIHDQMPNAAVGSERDLGVALAHAREAVHCIARQRVSAACHAFGRYRVAAEARDESVAFVSGFPARGEHSPTRRNRFMRKTCWPQRGIASSVFTDVVRFFHTEPPRGAASATSVSVTSVRSAESARQISSWLERSAPPDGPDDCRTRISRLLKTEKEQRGTQSRRAHGEPRRKTMELSVSCEDLLSLLCVSRFSSATLRQAVSGFQ